MKALKTLHAAMLCAVLGAAGSIALGDQVIMRDGKVYDGNVVSKTRRNVIIDTDINGIKARLTLDRRKIKSIIDGEVIAPPAVETETGSIPTLGTNEEEAPKPTLKRDGYKLLLEVPIEGTFGEHVYPLGIAHSLEWAVENGVTDVVFRINSPGGEVWAAQDMVAVMDRFADQLDYHMLIEHAISASIWPSFSCDTITMAPGATFGGAVVYSRNATGSAEVDLKMTSIMSAKLGSQAEANGHSEYLVKAMMLSAEAVYAYQKDGEWVLTNSIEAIPGNRAYETIDGPDSVLTLTAKQASKYGIVTSIDEKSLEAFALANNIDKWDSAGDIGHTIVKGDYEKCKRLREDLVASVKSFNANVAYLGNANYVSSAGSALQGMRKNLGKYKRLMKKAESYEMPSIVDGFDDVIDVPYWETEIEERLADLRRTRKRGP